MCHLDAQRPEVARRAMACAYCGQTGGMSQEHAFSDWIRREFKQIGPMESAVAGAPQKRIQSLIKTKDVCATCNNGPLSALDEYAKALGMHNDRSPSEPKTFSGDRDRLTRYLLKCAYNDARANLLHAQKERRPTSKFAAVVQGYRGEFAPYILGRAMAPMRLDVLAGLLDFSPSVGVGELPVQDPESRIKFNLWVNLAAHCFLVIGWKEKTDDSYRRARLRDICDQPWHWTWLDQDPFNAVQ